MLQTDGVSTMKSLERELHSFWNIEALVIVESEDVMHAEFSKNVHFENRRYIVSLPWRDACPPLPSKYGLSLCIGSIVYSED